VTIYYHNPEHMSIPFFKFSQKDFADRPAGALYHIKARKQKSF
jgi:hypothetical protein